MPDFGKNFQELVETSSEPLREYVRLAQAALNLCRHTRREDGKSREMLHHLIDKMRRNYGDVLRPRDLVSQEAYSFVNNYNVHSLFTKPLFVGVSSFSVTDFTPENVYVTDEGIRFPDLKVPYRGIPLIDVACMAGLARDVYELPRAGDGYVVLEEIALREMAKALSLTAEQGKALFSLGRAYQCSISAKFRVESEPEKAAVFAQESEGYLEQLAA